MNLINKLYNYFKKEDVIIKPSYVEYKDDYIQVKMKYENGISLFVNPYELSTRLFNECPCGLSQHKQLIFDKLRDNLKYDNTFSYLSIGSGGMLCDLKLLYTLLKDKHFDSIVVNFVDRCYYVRENEYDTNKDKYETLLNFFYQFTNDITINIFDNLDNYKLNKVDVLSMLDLGMLFNTYPNYDSYKHLIKEDGLIAFLGLVFDTDNHYYDISRYNNEFTSIVKFETNKSIINRMCKMMNSIKYIINPNILYFIMIAYICYKI